MQLNTGYKVHNSVTDNKDIEGQGDVLFIINESG